MQYSRIHKIGTEHNGELMIFICDIFINKWLWLFLFAEDGF